MKYFLIILFGLLFFACKKADERKCYKSFGEVIESEYPIDSVQEFKLYKKIKYKFYQDTLRKIVVRTGENMQNFIDVSTKDYITTINNYNKCNFLRSNDKIVEVDIHYPHYNKIYAEPSDSMVFVDTLRGNYTNIHLRDGGGTLKLNVNMNQIQIGISYGAGNFIIGGQANYAHLSIQNLAYGDALNLQTNNLSIYHNSNNDLQTNFDSSKVKVLFYANGDVRFVGEPLSLSVEGVGDGEVIHY
jgi:hypothetical protein